MTFCHKKIFVLYDDFPYVIPVWHEKCKQILQQQVLLKKVKDPKSTKMICLCISVPWTEFAVLAMFTKQKLVLPLFPQWRGHIAMVA